MKNGEGWDQYQRLVLAELERLATDFKTITVSLNSLQVEIAMLKVKSGFWGAIGGVAVFGVSLLLQYMEIKK